jgi:glycosyltransferase involved in cell wall biosynthesis
MGTRVDKNHLCKILRSELLASADLLIRKRWYASFASRFTKDCCARLNSPRTLHGTSDAATLRIVTNIDDFPREWITTSGIRGITQAFSTPWQLFVSSTGCDAILINCDPGLTYKLSALFLLFPLRRKPIIALDLVLRRPISPGSRLTRPLKKLLLSNVGHFIHYFRQLDGYQKYFGIGGDRSSYVRFKSDIRGRYSYAPDPNGDYVLCFGRSERDYDTFFKAMVSLPYLGAIPNPNLLLLAQHSSRLTIPLPQLPPNIRVLENDDSVARAVEIISKARVVALPIVSGRISASGIGTYLTAMLLGKCVIITEGPGSSDVLTDEALFVPPENPEVLSATIRRAWEDQELRERTAAAGQKYAESCGTSSDLYQRVLEVVVRETRGSP